MDPWPCPAPAVPLFPESPDAPPGEPAIGSGDPCFPRYGSGSCIDGEDSLVAADDPASSPEGPDRAGPLSVSVAPVKAPSADGPARFPIPPFSWPDGTGDCKDVPAFIPDPAAVTGESCRMIGLSPFPVLAVWLPARDPAALPEDPGEPATEESGDWAAWDPGARPADPMDVPVKDPIPMDEEPGNVSPEDPIPLPAGDPMEESAPDDDAGPDCPGGQLLAGRHAIQVPSARIRRIQQKRLFIPVLYAEVWNKYRLIAAVTYHQFQRSGEKNGRGGRELNDESCSLPI